MSKARVARVGNTSESCQIDRMMPNRNSEAVYVYMAVYISITYYEQREKMSPRYFDRIPQEFPPKTAIHFFVNESTYVYRLHEL